MTTTTPSTSSFDPVELEVFKQLFASVAEEMGVRLMRSAFSPNIKERLDFSCALFDTTGDMIAQAAHIPVHLGSAPASVKAVLGAFPPDAISPGDRFIVNDPFAGGTHLPDVTVVAPVHPAGETAPRFFVATRAHHADVGGTTPGSMGLTTHIDDEGVRLPPTKITDAVLLDFCHQTRTPDERLGDLRAQLASLDVGIARLRELCHDHTPDRIIAAGDALQAYTARFIRAMLADLPDGTFHFEDLLDDDGVGHTDLPLRCDLTLAGDRATVDLTGCCDQTPGPLNAVRAIAQSAALYCFRCLAPADLPSNSGVLRPIHILTRPGSIADATAPAAVAGGNVETSQRLVDVIFGALAQAAPTLVPAASCGSMNNILVGSRDHTQHLESEITNPKSEIASPETFTYYETLAGGAGAGPHADGGHAIHTHMTNTLNTPVEALEHSYPFRITRYAIRDSNTASTTSKPGASRSDAPGSSHTLKAPRHLGGQGLIRGYTFDQPVHVTLLTERRNHPPYGLAGGAPGQPGRNILLPPNQPPHDLPPKCALDLGPGDTLEIHTPSGGSWGAEV